MKNSILLIFCTCFLSFIPPDSLLEEEIQAFEATNKYRLKKGEGLLVLDTFLCQIAREHSQKMADGKVDFGHDGFDKRVKRIEKKFGMELAAAENVFMSSAEADGNQAVDEWIDSPGHRENMLTPRYKRVGIGKANGKEGTFYTQIFSD